MKRNEQNSMKTCGALCATSAEIESSPVTVALLKGSQEVEVCLNHVDRSDHTVSPKFSVKVSEKTLSRFLKNLIFLKPVPNID